MTIHFFDQDQADEAAVAAMQIIDIDNDATDGCVSLDDLAALQLGARGPILRRRLPGLDILDGTAADGRMFRAIVAGEHVVVDYADHAPRAGTTDSAANDDRIAWRR